MRMSTDVTHPQARSNPLSLPFPRLWWMAVLAATGFLVHAWLVHVGAWQGIDHRLMWWLHGWASPGLDRFFHGVSAIGHERGVIPLDVLLLVLLSIRRRWRQALFVLVATAGSGVLNWLVKMLFARERPQLWPALTDAHNASFPSGHAMGSFTLMLVLLILAWPSRWRYPLLLSASGFIVLVGLSRLYLGVHWPSDIVAGWLLAASWVFAISACTARQQGGELCRRTDIS